MYGRCDDPPYEELPYNYAVLGDQALATSMVAGGVYNVAIIMSNTGSTTWTSAGNYHLGSRNPFDNLTWGGSRVPLAQSVPLGQNEMHRFCEKINQR